VGQGRGRGNDDFLASPGGWSVVLWGKGEGGVMTIFRPVQEAGVRPSGRAFCSVYCRTLENLFGLSASPTPLSAPNFLSISLPVKGESATSPSLIPKLPPSAPAKLPLHDSESFSETPKANLVPLFSIPKVPVVHS